MNFSRENGIFDWLQEEVKPVVDERIKEKISPYKFSSPLIYHIETGGKRWRPGLTFIMGSLCGVSSEELLDVAAGIELLHNFTLIHDDVIDGDGYRRNKPTVWMKYGKDSAINYGDMMFAQAIRAFPGEVRDEATETALEIFRGQQMDLNFRERNDVTVDEYMEMIQGKTGELLNLCLEAPQVMSQTKFSLEDYSLLGPAFQIRDDLLDFEEGKGRKRIGNDVKEGKRSLMVVHANSEEVYRILDKPVEDTTEEDVEYVKEKLEEKGSMDFARSKMRDLCKKAVNSLKELPESEEKDMLEKFANFLVEREV